jgi:Heat shock protein
MNRILLSAFIFSICLTSCGTSRKTTTHNSQITIENPIAEKHWKLVELRGAPVENKSGKEAFIVFSAEDMRVHGNYGCNNFTGSYKLEEGNRISFSQMAGTMMMCMDMEVEQAFSEVLRMADNYYVDGNHLVLNRARMAPLARFVAVYP